MPQQLTNPAMGHPPLLTGLAKPKSRSARKAKEVVLGPRCSRLCCALCCHVCKSWSFTSQVDTIYHACITVRAL